MPECYVTLDKYKNDLSRQFARDKLIIERCERFLADFRSNKACLSCVNGDFIVRFEMLVEMLKQPLDMWFTDREWSEPIFRTRDKFSSVSDGVQESLCL